MRLDICDIRIICGGFKRPTWRSYASLVKGLHKEQDNVKKSVKMNPELKGNRIVYLSLNMKMSWRSQIITKNIQEKATHGQTDIYVCIIPSWLKGKVQCKIKWVSDTTFYVLNAHISIGFWQQFPGCLLMLTHCCLK